MKNIKAQRDAWSHIVVHPSGVLMAALKGSEREGTEMPNAKRAHRDTLVLMRMWLCKHGASEVMTLFLQSYSRIYHNEQRRPPPVERKAPLFGCIKFLFLLFSVLFSSLQKERYMLCMMHSFVYSLSGLSFCLM